MYIPYRAFAQLSDESGSSSSSEDGGGSDNDSDSGDEISRPGKPLATKEAGPPGNHEYSENDRGAGCPSPPTDRRVMCDDLFPWASKSHVVCLSSVPRFFGNPNFPKWIKPVLCDTVVDGVV